MNAYIRVSWKASYMRNMDATKSFVDVWVVHFYDGTLERERESGMGWDGITNEFFKVFVPELKAPLTMIFQEVWSSGKMPDSWKVGLVKLIPKVASPIHVFCSMVTNIINGWVV